MWRLATLMLLLLAGCSRAGEAGRSTGADTVAEGDLALPPSARAPRAPQAGGAPDTVVPGAPDDTLTAEGSVGPVPPPVLDVGVIAGGYREHYVQQFHEIGSDVRGGVDPELVEDAKRRTALDLGFVDVGAWSDMLGELSAEQRANLADAIAATNRDLARELHGAAQR
jgi:hypothetical protein